jgi:ferric-dicitrate binding protein FerR (iron transport regulator)
MNEGSPDNLERPLTDHDEAAVGRVVRLARRYPAPSPQRRQAAFERVQAEWREATAPRQRRWATRPVAIAASVVVALLAAGLFVARGGAGGPTVANVEAVSGSEGTVAGAGWLARVTRADELQAGAALQAGELVATGAQTVARLRVGPSLELRVAGGSQLRFDAADRLTLLRGQVYVDSGAATGASSRLVVSTVHGDVQHVGTRYLARVDGASLEVAVREGRVRVERAGRAPIAAEAVAGESLQIGDASQTIARRKVALHGDAWAWLAAMPAAFDVEGATLDRFLAWYEAETGRSVVFTDEARRDRAASITLRGRIAGLTPDQALAAIAPTVEMQVARDAPAGEVRVALP